jgi:hypothetical protein
VPDATWPTRRGFQQFYGTLDGCGSYFAPRRLTRGEQDMALVQDLVPPHVRPHSDCPELRPLRAGVPNRRGVSSGAPFGSAVSENPRGSGLEFAIRKPVRVA